MVGYTRWQRLRHGDTLIEVVFALAILATLITAVTTGAVAAWRTSRVAGERTAATAVVEEQAEALRAYRGSMDWPTFTGSLPLGLGSYINPADPVNPNKQFMMVIDSSGGVQTWKHIDCTGVSTCTGGVGNRYTISITAAPGDDSVTTNVWKFVITATWKSPGRNQLNKSDQVIYIGDSNE